MNAALVVENRRTVLAAGMGKECHLFSLRYKLQEESDENAEGKNAGEPMPKADTEADEKLKAANGDLRRRKKEGEKADGSGDGGTASAEGPTKGGRNGFLNHRGMLRISKCYSYTKKRKRDGRIYEPTNPFV